MALDGFKPQIPSVLSLFRVVAIPGFFGLYDSGYAVTSFVLLCLMILSDALDGWVARRWGVESELGAVLDPVCDRVFSIFLFSHLILLGKLSILIGGVFVFRNLAQVLSVPILKVLNRTFHVKAKFLPKFITGISMGLLPIVYYCEMNSFWIWSLLFVVVIGELWIIVTYFPRLIQIIRGHHDTFE